jgi:uncharacterized membrane protein YfcA
VFELTLVDAVLLAVVSLAICVLTTSLAVESAALFLPGFLVGFPLLLPSFPAVSPNEAIGLVLVIMFFGQTSALAAYLYRGQVRRRLAGTVLLVTVPLAAAGRVVSYFVPGGLLLVVFAVLVLVLSAVVYRAARTTPDDVETHDCATAAVADATTTRSHRDRSERVAFTVGDWLAFGVGGLVGGLTGFATGEVTNTRLHASKGVPLKLSTGTSTLVLYLTLASANLVNVTILHTGAFGVEGTVSPPWGVAVVVAPVVLVGGQVGPYLNSRLDEATITNCLLATYALVGVVTLGRLL